MYRVRREDLPFRGRSHQFVGADNGEVNVSVSCSMANAAVGRVRIATPTTRSSSFRKGAAYGT